MRRYAIYFAPPPEHWLWRFGSAVIGYDAATGRDVPFPDFIGDDAPAWFVSTEEPRRYGFHATLKAPFELGARIEETQLIEEVAALASNLEPVSLPALEVAALGRFVALVPSANSRSLQDFAFRVVGDLDHLRAPLGGADRARRLKASLTPRQTEYLDRYGYPYVGEQFRFHMTLTGPLDDLERVAARKNLADAYGAVASVEPVAIDALAVFVQETRNSRFRIIARVPLSHRQGV